MRLQTLPLQMDDTTAHTELEDDKENQSISPSKMQKQNSKNRLMKQLLNSANKISKQKENDRMQTFLQGFSVCGQKISSSQPRNGQQAQLDRLNISRLKMSSNINENLQLNTFEQLIGENFLYHSKINQLTNKIGKLTAKPKSYAGQNKQQRIFENIVHQYFAKQQKSIQKAISYNQDAATANSNEGPMPPKFARSAAKYQMPHSITPKLKKRNKNYLSKSPMAKSSAAHNQRGKSQAQSALGNPNYYTLDIRDQSAEY